MSQVKQYEPGMLKMVPRCANCGSTEDTCDPEYDSPRHDQVLVPHFQLPHSCDAWIIGDAVALRLLLDEAEALLAGR